MKPARAPRARASDERLLRIDPAAGTWSDAAFGDLADLLSPGDLIVFNDSATLPASVRATTEEGAPVEVRLCALRPDGAWTAALFGDGDWRRRTEDRGPPPVLAPGAGLRVSERLGMVVRDVSRASPRLVGVAFDRDGTALWRELYRVGRPIQYSYLEEELALWDVQSHFAARPWSVEMPSAGRPFTWELLGALRERGVRWATLTHAAGISSLGSPELDALLPLPERYELPAATVEHVAAAKARGGRVVAVGTTVVRALEGAAVGGGLLAGAGFTDLRVDAAFRPRVVDALVTGMHERTTSHFQVLEAFVPRAVLAGATEHAEAAGYLAHEFGDSTLVLRSQGPLRRDGEAEPLHRPPM